MLGPQREGTRSRPPRPPPGGPAGEREPGKETMQQTQASESAPFTREPLPPRCSLASVSLRAVHIRIPPSAPFTLEHLHAIHTGASPSTPFTLQPLPPQKRLRHTLSPSLPGKCSRHREAWGQAQGRTKRGRSASRHHKPKPNGRQGLSTKNMPERRDSAGPRPVTQPSVRTPCASSSTETSLQKEAARAFPCSPKITSIRSLVGNIGH